LPSGELDDDLRLDICRLTTKTLAGTAPLVRVWRYRDDEPEVAVSEVEFDLGQITVTPVASANHKIQHYTMKLQLPDDVLMMDVEPDDPVYGVSIEGRDVPMRTVIFSDKSLLGPMLNT